VAFSNLLKVVGMPGTIEVETNSILLDNGLDVTPYDPAFNKLFPSLPYVIPEEEFKGREDLRFVNSEAKNILNLTLKIKFFELLIVIGHFLDS